MKELFWFECRKIFSRKLVWAGLALILVVSAGGFSDIHDVAYNQEIAARYAGTLTDAKVQAMLKEFQPTQEQREQWGSIDLRYIGRNSTQTAVYRYFANEDGSWNGKTVKEVFGEETIIAGYAEGWLDFGQNLVKVMVFLAVLTVIMTAPVFSAERGGMERLLLCSKNGKWNGAAAKILAGLFAPVAVCLIFLAGNLLAIRGVLGTAGLDASILFSGISYETWSVCNISCRTMLIYQCVLAVSGILMLSGITLAVSAICPEQVTALIVGAALLFAPLALITSEQTPFYRILLLSPICQIQFSELLGIGNSGGNMPYAALGVPAAAGTALLGIWAALRAWRRIK